MLDKDMGSGKKKTKTKKKIETKSVKAVGGKTVKAPSAGSEKNVISIVSSGKAGESTTGRKNGRGVRTRNPNLKLIKNDDLLTKKKKIPKKETYAAKPYKKYEDKVYAERQGVGEWFIQHKSLVLIGLTVFSVIVVLAAAYYYVITNYAVTTVYVDGNIHYSNEEVMDMVMAGTYGNNSLYLALKYKDKGVEDVPFVEKMDVNILTPNTIRINIYEKALAGYVEYLGRYMYFDREGTVVESSKERTMGIPQVTGLKFGYVILNEPLPVENDMIFKRILGITQLLAKYELAADKIFFDSDYDVTLYFEGVRVTMGPSEEIDEKIMRLQYILPQLSGKSGTLRMENYTEDSKSIPFNQD